LKSTALLFPTGGYQWPGMGADLEEPPHRDGLDRIEAALEPLGVAPGALRALMTGPGQSRRSFEGDRWVWSGDFPLSMVAQFAVGSLLGRALIARHGPPRATAGESMGELAAYAVAGVLSLEEGARLTWRWARHLQNASDPLGLRMAVVEDIPEQDFRRFAGPLQANVVVGESPGLFVVALPVRSIAGLEAEVSRRGGRLLVSSNACAAHEPRLGESAAIWAAHDDELRSITFERPAFPLFSTLHPRALLQEPEELRENRRQTTFVRVRWDDTLRAMAAWGIERFVQIGPPSSGYAVKKLRGQDTGLRQCRIKIIGTLAGLG